MLTNYLFGTKVIFDFGVVFGVLLSRNVSDQGRVG
jgi:hypothetical protein